MRKTTCRKRDLCGGSGRAVRPERSPPFATWSYAGVYYEGRWMTRGCCAREWKTVVPTQGNASFLLRERTWKTTLPSRNRENAQKISLCVITFGATISFIYFKK